MKPLSSVADWDLAGTIQGMEMLTFGAVIAIHSLRRPLFNIIDLGIGRPENIIQPLDPALKILFCSH